MKGDVKPSMMSEEEYDEPERPDSTTSPIVVAFWEVKWIDRCVRCANEKKQLEALKETESWMTDLPLLQLLNPES